MPRSSEEILSPSRAELARGRPRAALREMERARSELLAAGDSDGLRELLDLAHGVRTLAPVDTKARERLLIAIERDIQPLSPGAIPQAISKPEDAPVSPPPSGPFSPYGSFSAEQILAPARAEIERHKTGRALRRLEKARRKLLTRGDLDGLEALIDLTQRIPSAKPRHESARRRLIYAARQNVGYLSRREAIKTGKDWHDPVAAASPTTSLPSLPPMTWREKLIAVAVALALAGGITALALLDRVPQRVAHAIKCPTGEQGSPTWSPDGKKIAFAKNRECGTQITVVSVKSGRLRTVSNGYGVLPDWSPDGRTILYRSSDGVSVVPVRGGESRLLRSDDDDDMGASWSPNGKEIAFTHGQAPSPEPFSNGIDPYESTLYVMPRNAARTEKIVGDSCSPGTPAWSPGGQKLAFGCSDGIYVSDLSGRRMFRFVNESFDPDYWCPPKVSWSPDGRSIAFGWNGVEVASGENGVSQTGTRTRKVIAQVNDSDDATIDVAWAPDGKRIAFSVTGTGDGDGLYVIDRNGKNRRRLVKF